MLCPFCKTENRDDRDVCYNCEKPLFMLRLIVQKARAHFNTALEFAERERDEEAIAELDNALDLDRSHVNSHIVLGTLYAKRGEMEKAEQHWRQALEVDPRFLKAHEYLEKLETGRKNLPVVRRQRFYIVALAVFLCVAGFSTFFLLWRSAGQPSSDRLNLAWARYQKNDDATALDILNSIPKGQEKGSLVSGQAALLSQIIRDRENLLLTSAQKYLSHYDIAKADRQVDALLERKLPREVKQKAAQLRQRLVETSEGAVAVALGLYGEGKASEEAVSQVLNTHEQVAGAKDEFLTLSRHTLASESRNRKIQAAVDRFLKKEISRTDLLTELVDLSKQYPDYPNINRVIAFHAAPEEKSLNEAFEKALKSADFGTAAESINSLQRLWGITGNKDGSKHLADYRKRVEDSRVEKMLADVQSSYASNDYEKTAELAEAALSKPIDDTSRAALQTLLGEVNIKLADQRWQWIRTIDRRYIDNNITVEEAEKTIRYYPQVQKYLSRKAYANVDDDMLFYLAMAYRRINQPDKSQAAFEDLKKQYPKSLFVRWVKHYQEADAKAKKSG